MTRYLDPSEPVRGPPADNFVIIPIFSLSLTVEFSFVQDRDELQTSNKWSPRRTNVHLNTNNSNNNPTSTRIATVKSARRENGLQPNVNNFN